MKLARMFTQTCSIFDVSCTTTGSTTLLSLLRVVSTKRRTAGQIDPSPEMAPISHVTVNFLLFYFFDGGSQEERERTFVWGRRFL